MSQARSIDVTLAFAPSLLQKQPEKLFKRPLHGSRSQKINFVLRSDDQGSLGEQADRLAAN